MKNVLEYLENIDNKNNKVIDELGEITYIDLINNSKKIGSALIQKIDNIGPIPIFMEKGILTLETFWGSVYAGGFYSLLNVGLPKARLLQILDVLSVSFVITDLAHKELAQEYFEGYEIIFVEDLLDSSIQEEKLRDIRNNALDIDPLYINFTSGSTGVPKGVVVSHRSVIDFIDNFTKVFDINDKDIIANQAPFDFDVSVKDIYSAIKTGATLVIIPKTLFSKPAQLLDFLIDYKVTTLIWAVSALCLISTFHGLDYKVPKTINKILFSGEVMPKKHLQEWMKHLPSAKFVNLYGPTEITCNCTYHVIDKTRCYDKIPIGIPFNNENVFLLSSDKTLITEHDQKGEICVRGSALALGYYNNFEQTNKVFVQNPLNNCYLDLIYCSGDLGYYNESNELFFAGRKDFQIKYLGHRIELEEIDSSIGLLPEVERVCTIFDEEKNKLYAFYVGNITKQQLHEKLRVTLPIYMIPGKFVQLEKMPLSKNGKIDRKELMKMVRK